MKERQDFTCASDRTSGYNYKKTCTFFLIMNSCLISSVVEEWNRLPYKVVCFPSLPMPRICIAALSKSL